MPEQQIHADLHIDNFLISYEGDNNGLVTGLLDFEFSSHDWRVMELCVGISKYVASEGIIFCFSEYSSYSYSYSYS